MTRGRQAAHRRRRGARWPLALAGSAQEPTEQHELVDVAGVPRQHDPGGVGAAGETAESAPVEVLRRGGAAVEVQQADRATVHDDLGPAAVTRLAVDDAQPRTGESQRDTTRATAGVACSRPIEVVSFELLPSRGRGSP